MKLCETCHNQHDGNFGSGRFCCKKCACSYSTKNSRHEINQKVKNALIGRKASIETIDKMKESWKSRKSSNSYYRRSQTNIEDICVVDSIYTTKYVKERLFRDNLKKYECEECGLYEWRNKPITLQLHHKNGKNKDHRLENLQILCPMCHSQTDNYAGRNRRLRILTGKMH